MEHNSLKYNWGLKVFERWNKQIGIILKIFIVIILASFISIYVKVGYDFTQEATGGFFEIILYAILIAAGTVFFLFVSYFSGTREINLKWLIFSIGLAVGGASTGAIGGLVKGFAGWSIGGIIGISALFLNFKFYTRHLR